MHQCEEGCPQGSGYGRLPSIARALLATGCAAIALAIGVGSHAQTPLPPVTVEAKAPKKRAKAAPKAPPKGVESQPAEVKAAEPDDKARSEAVYKTPAGVSFASKADIETFGKLDAGDVLRGMPGTFTRESPQSAGLAINIRGFEGAGRVNMMIDGVRQGFRFTSHEAQGFVFVDPQLLAGIDIARGAITTAGGAGALAGAANLRTLDVEDILAPGKTVGVLSTVTYGTNGVGWQEMLSAAMQSESVGIAAAFGHSEPDDYRNGAGVTVPFTSQDLNSGLLKLNFALTPEQSLKLGAVLYENDFFANSNLQHVASETYTVKYAFKPTGNPLVDFAFNAHANRVQMEYLSGAFPGRILTDEGKGLDVANTSRFSLGAVKVAATYGYEYFMDDVSEVLGGVNAAGDAAIWGTFSQTKFSLGIFDLITGLRYDSYSIEGTFDPDGLLGNAPLARLDKSYSHLSPKVTLAAQVLPWFQPFITFSEAFRAPTINETMLGGSHPTAIPGPLFLPNPDLKPEIQTGWEVGANITKDNLFAPGDAFRFKAVYFNMDVENYITGVVGFHTQCPPFCPPLFTRFENLPGTSHIEGVELEGRYDAGFFFGSLAYTYTNSDLPSQLGGLGAPSTLPDHIAALTLGMRLLDRKLTLGTRVSYFSESDIGAVNAGPGAPPPIYLSQFMPAYTLVDLFSSYQFNNGLKIGLTATNVFDVEYTPALSTPFAFGGACFGGNAPGCNDTGRGRTILLTAKMKF